MATIKVLGGDFLKRDGMWKSGNVMLYTKNSFLPDARYSGSEIASLEVALEENVKRPGGTVGGAAVGGVLLGPIGILGGALLGGRGKDATFTIRFTDGRRALVTTSSDTYKQVLAAKGF